jgi:hypothetical protein
MQAPPASQAPSYPGPQQAGTPSWPTGGVPAGPTDPLAQYAPARRKPTVTELPGSIRTATRLMYLGFAVTALDLFFGFTTLARYTRDVTNTKNALAAAPLRLVTSEQALLRTQDQLVTVMVVAVVTALVGLISWAWVAIAARRGHGWTRTAGTVLLGLYTICTLIVCFGSKNAPGAQYTTALVWIIGVAAVIPLWSRGAREFFASWRRR